MNLWIKVIVLLIFSELKCLNGIAEDGCDKSANSKRKEEEAKCNPFRFPDTSGFADIKMCCEVYYRSCFEIKSIIKFCDLLPDFNGWARRSFGSILAACKDSNIPNKDKCAKTYQSIPPDGCPESDYSDCKSVIWNGTGSDKKTGTGGTKADTGTGGTKTGTGTKTENQSGSSFTPISMNGLVLWLSFIVPLIIRL